MWILRGLTAIALIAVVSDPSMAQPRVVTSIYPLRAIVEAVGGEKVTVINLVPRGVDPHNFELTPSAAIALEKADLVFIIGSAFDGWAIKSLPQKHRRIVDLHTSFADSLIPLGGTFNPHIWLDPLMAKQIAQIVTQKLSQISPPDSDSFSSRFEAFSSAIDSLNAWIRKTLEENSFDEFVSLHPAWSYFARRYRIREMATIEISGEREPSARHVANVIRVLRRMKRRCIVGEEFSNPGLANSVALATDAKVVMLDPLGGPDLGERSSYISLLKYNVRKLVLECCKQGN